MTSDVNINGALNGIQATTGSAEQLDSDFNDFLRLLTVQLQNQDPLSPIESTEFTNQLVAFTGVEQQINSNQKLDDLISLGLGNSFSSSLNYVGKDVSYIGSDAYYDGQTPKDIKYSVDGTAVSTTINIFDDESTLVFSHTVTEDDPAGEFTWDGKGTNGNDLPAGTYSVRIDALDNEDEPLETTTVVEGHVDGIETQNGVTFLIVGERAVSIANVIKVVEASVAAETNET